MKPVQTLCYILLCSKHCLFSFSYFSPSCPLKFLIGHWQQGIPLSPSPQTFSHQRLQWDPWGLWGHRQPWASTLGATIGMFSWCPCGCVGCHCICLLECKLGVSWFNWVLYGKCEFGKSLCFGRAQCVAEVYLVVCCLSSTLTCTPWPWPWSSEGLGLLWSGVWWLPVEPGLGKPSCPPRLAKPGGCCKTGSKVWFASLSVA